MNAEHDDDRLRQAFRALAEDAEPRGDCPDADRLWAAVHGELAPAETRELIEHTAGCPVCAEAWRLAAAAGGERAVAEAPAEWRGGGWRRWAAAVAAVLVVIVVGVELLDGPSAPVERQPAEEAIRSLVPEGVPQPRDDLRLRWEGPAGASYRLTVSTEDLRVIAAAERLSASEYQVSEEALAGLPAGSRLLWRVEASLPEGGTRASPTYLIELE